MSSSTDGVNASCEWREEDPWGAMPGTYESACGETWAFTEGGVVENGVKFCHNCGKPVKVVPFPQPADEADDVGVTAAPAPQGAKVYCCYGAYCDAGHDSTCKNAAGVPTPSPDQGESHG